MKYTVTINNKQYEVEVERGQANLIKTTEVAASSAPAPVAAAPVAAGLPAGDPIAAPMPGTVLDIKAGQGTAVKKGDVVLILEAMKMENEIRAHRDGVVAHVAVAKGTSVSTDDVLMILK